MAEYRLATRRSPLAIAQASIVGRLLARAGHGSSLIEVTTTGDRDLLTPVTTLTEVGAFVRAVQAVVLDGAADMAVHSAKDLPVDGPPDLATFYPERAAVSDVICGGSLDSLPEGAAVGTGSPRRSAQLRALRPDLQLVAVRGNVGTRLEKVARGELDAVVLAEAGLVRLGMENAIDQRLDTTMMVPAPAQAALAVETRQGSEAATAAAGIEDDRVEAAVRAERLLLAATGAGCRSALGAYARYEGRTLRMTAFVEDERGPRRAEVDGDHPETVAMTMKEELGL